MTTIDDVIAYTNLKEPFIRRCLSEIEVLKQYIKRGDKNKILLDSNSLAIFDQIKQFKEKGLALSEINKQLANTVKHPNKQNIDDTQTQLNTAGNSAENRQENKVLSLTHKLHESEKDKIRAEHALDLIKNNLKLLPAGGDVDKSRQILEIISKLEILTRPKGWKISSKTKEIDRLWGELKGLL